MSALRWVDNRRNHLLMLGNKYVGYFYPDASEGIDVDAVLRVMAASMEMMEALQIIALHAPSLDADGIREIALPAINRTEERAQ